jgi:putative MATE family efflux protein
LKISGASDNTYAFAKEYLIVIALGAPLIILGFSLGQIIRAEGAAKEAMFGMMLGTVLNIILDPILILWAGWGVKGAAVATVFANLVSVIYYLQYFKSGKSSLSVSWNHFSIDYNIMREVFSIGIPASLNSVLMSASNIVLNNYAASYGDDVVAAFGVAGRINMLPIFLMIGLAQGVQPLLGYNYAAGNMTRMRGTMKFTGIAAALIGSFFAVLFFFTGRSLVRIFIDDSSVIMLGEQFIKIIIMSLPVLGILMLITVTFQAIGAARPSLILSIARQGFVFLPVLVIFNYFFGMDGLVFAQPIADIGAVALALFLFRKI